MHEFKVRRGRLYCEDVLVDDIAQAVGTPVYVYSYATLVGHFRKLQTAFRSIRPLICFSVKANGNLSILKILVQHGAGLDIVSGGELYKALRAGCPPTRIVYASVGKSPEEIRQALQAGIFCFNVESIAELRAINEAAQRENRLASVALRINPDVRANTHHYITTGTAESKFGISLAAIDDLVLRHWQEYPSLRLLGFHLHIGSQITEAKPFLQAIAKAGALIRRLRAAGVSVQWMNLGGGLGIVYKDERPQTARAFAKAVLPAIRRLGVRLILEPGRFIVGNAGVLVTRALYEKGDGRSTPANGARFLVVDSGMNDLIRPALYGAYHDVVPTRRTQGRGVSTYHIVGPVCESADVLARDRQLPQVRSGEYLAVFGAGAYGFVMASNYNGRPRAAEVLVRGRRWYIVRRRETYQDLVRHDLIPRAILS